MYYTYILTHDQVPFAILMALQGFVIQTFFAHRVYSLYRKMWLSALIMIPITLAAAILLYTAVSGRSGDDQFMLRTSVV